MKKATIISTIIILVITSCTYKLTNSNYTTVEPWKEWEIELKFNNDSTFKMTDSFGCNLFNYSGQWHYHKDAVLEFIILNDTTKSEYIKSHDMYQFFNKETQKLQVVRADKYFPVISTDTVWILNKRQISFRGLVFDRQRLSKEEDLSKKRVKMIEDFYIGKMGRELFIKTFGDGKGIEEARKNIKECKDYPIPNLEIGKDK